MDGLMVSSFIFQKQLTSHRLRVRDGWTESSVLVLRFSQPLAVKVFQCAVAFEGNSLKQFLAALCDIAFGECIYGMLLIRVLM